jgi:hypothetical protein
MRHREESGLPVRAIWFNATGWALARGLHQARVGSNARNLSSITGVGCRKRAAPPSHPQAPRPRPRHKRHLVDTRHRTRECEACRHPSSRCHLYQPRLYVRAGCSIVCMRLLQLASCFEKEILVIPSRGYNSYTGTFTITYDYEKIDELTNADEYNVVLELTAEAKSNGILQLSKLVLKVCGAKSVILRIPWLFKKSTTIYKCTLTKKL